MLDSNTKVGDKVFVWTAMHSMFPLVREVTEVTPAGNIKVAGSIYNKNGRLRGRSAWSNGSISDYNEQDAVEYVNRKKAKGQLYDVSNFIWSNALPETIAQVHALLFPKDK